MNFEAKVKIKLLQEQNIRFSIVKTNIYKTFCE